MSKSIDIIIPTYARPGAARLLAGTLEHVLSPGDRIYIIYQGDEGCASEEDGLFYYLNSAPPNLPKARNKGIAAGKGDIILFLDDDVELLDEHILAAHRRAHEDDGLGAVAGFVKDDIFVENGDVCTVYDATTGEIIQNFSLSRQQETISVMGAHMSFKRKALEAIGGFDEHFKKNALWEDIDCAFRIRKAGWKILYCPDAKVRHVRTHSGGCRAIGAEAYTYHQFANTAYFAARFAQRRYYGAWIRFWKYRLEYVSRRRFLWMRHSPFIVMAGVLGACGGIVRYLTNNPADKVL